MGKRQCISCGADYGSDHIKGCLRYQTGEFIVDDIKRRAFLEEEIDRLTKEVASLEFMVSAKDAWAKGAEIENEQLKVEAIKQGEYITQLMTETGDSLMKQKQAEAERDSLRESIEHVQKFGDGRIYSSSDSDAVIAIYRHLEEALNK
jgi:hypothetical protein